MILQQRIECDEIINESEVIKALAVKKKENLEHLVTSLIENGKLPQEWEDGMRFFLKGKDWILNECIYDNHLSLRNSNSNKHFYGLIEAYIKEAKTRKITILNEIELWIEQNSFDFDRVSQRVGILPKHLI